MQPTIDLRGARVLITGATGFIGGRLAEYLVLGCNARVRALVRHHGRAVHLARLPIELTAGDVLDKASVDAAVQGCDIVFHCAYGSAGEDDERRQVTLDGTQNLIQAASTHKVRRFVHLSTVAVHGPNPGPVITDDTPYIYSGDNYSDAKIEAEKAAFHLAAADGLPLVVLRPAVVYGPRSIPWTISPVKRLQANDLTLIEGGSGVANHVYIDDVVQAMLLAAVRPEAPGEAFLISHGTAVSWREFYSYYTKMLGCGELPDLTLAEIGERQARMQRLRNPLFYTFSFAGSPRARSIVADFPGIGAAYRGVARVTPSRVRHAIVSQAEALRETKLQPPVLPRQWSIDYFRAKSVCKIDKASRLLGYRPVVSLCEGMRLTEAWLRDTRLI